MKRDTAKETVLEQLKKTPIVYIACQNSGVGKATYYRWCNEDKDFKQKADDALNEGIKLINDLAESKLIANINEQNMSAIIWWLRNRHPAYRDKLEIRTKKDKNEELTPEEQNTVEEALKLAKLSLNPQQNGSETDCKQLGKESEGTTSSD